MCGMRSIFAAAVLGLFAVTSLQAGRLDLAVIQYGGHLGPEDLAPGFAKVQLMDITDSDRTVTKEEAVKGGWVLFAQSLTMSRGNTVVVSTRLRNDRADTVAKLGASDVSISVSLIQGVKLGLRNFVKKVYSGTAPLPNNVTTVLGIRQFRVRGPKVIKEKAEMTTTDYTTVVVAQYVP